MIQVNQQRIPAPDQQVKSDPDPPETTGGEGLSK